MSGLTIPWAVGGERIERDGTAAHDPGEWPDFPVRAIRLWDTRTTWLHLEPADDQWDFATLDAHLAKAAQEGVDDVTLVLAGTPRWASVRETADDAPWLGPGSASPPKDMEQWREYVRTVATRYAGRIDHYEIGNEPNLLTFWNGTVREFSDLVRSATEEIRSADPSATVIVNAALLRRPADLEALDTWLAPLAGNGMIDAVSVHVYPRAADLPRLPELLEQARARVGAAGFGDLPLWVTEINVQDGSSMAGPDQESAIGDSHRPDRGGRLRAGVLVRVDGPRAAQPHPAGTGHGRGARAGLEVITGRSAARSRSPAVRRRPRVPPRAWTPRRLCR